MPAGTPMSGKEERSREQEECRAWKVMLNTPQVMASQPGLGKSKRKLISVLKDGYRIWRGHIQAKKL